MTPTPKVRRYPYPGRPVSVTSVLGAVWPKPGLEHWFQTEAVKLGREHPALDPAAVVALREKQKGPADRGITVHKAIRAHLTDRIMPDMGPDALTLFNLWWNWWDTRKMDPLSAEMTIVHPSGYAGTLDLLAHDSFGVPDSEFGEARRVVVDWKTCTQVPETPWDDHLAQVAAYAEGTYIDPRTGELWPLGAIDGGMVVYISPKEVKAFLATEDEWKRAKASWRACWEFFLALWPEFRWVGQLQLAEATRLIDGRALSTTPCSSPH